MKDSTAERTGYIPKDSVRHKSWDTWRVIVTHSDDYGIVSVSKSLATKL